MPPTAAPLVSADAAAVRRAARLVRAGALVAFPTETVYGLGADATNDEAIAAVYAAKDRPRVNPLIVHLDGAAAAEREASFDTRARRLAERFWPGALTLVVRRRADSRLSPLVSSGLDTVGVRVPAHPVALALLAAARRPVAAPSANPSGRLSPTTAKHVAAALGGRVALILDAGPCRIGVESTVVDLSAPDVARLLRPGGVPRAAIEAEIGALAGPGSAGGSAEASAGVGPPRAPGMMMSHYAPGRPLRLDARTVRADEALLAFGPDVPEGAAATLNLSPAGDLDEAAANLFAMLHTLDRPEFAAIAVAPIAGDGRGAAINDRLRRAVAAGRDAA